MNDIIIIFLEEKNQYALGINTEKGNIRILAYFKSEIAKNLYLEAINGKKEED